MWPFRLLIRSYILPLVCRYRPQQRSVDVGGEPTPRPRLYGRHREGLRQVPPEPLVAEIGKIGARMNSLDIIE